MARYRRVHTKIWADPEIMELSVDSKLVFLYLITNEYLNESGLYPLSFRRISFDTGLKMETVKESIANLCKTTTIKYDYDNSIVWVVKFLKYQPQSPNCIKSVNKDIDMNRKTPFCIELFNMYKDEWSDMVFPASTVEIMKKTKKPVKVKEPKKFIDICYELTEFMIKNIQKIKPDFKFIGNPKRNWPEKFDMMIRIDKRNPGSIKSVMEWVYKNDFWMKNILSAEKLRKQFDKLELRMLEDPEYKRKKYHESRPKKKSVRDNLKETCVKEHRYEKKRRCDTCYITYKPMFKFKTVGECIDDSRGQKG